MGKKIARKEVVKLGMRYLIASDIHGSLGYVELLLDRFNEEKADMLILLGDILYHGPRNDLPAYYNPTGVAVKLNEYKDKIICVRGNCDAEVDQMMLQFPILCDFGVMEIDGRFFYLTHGHKYSIKNPPAVRKGSVVLSGHTHVPMAKESDGIYYINPGSISLPKGDSYPSYIVLENGKFWFKDLLTGIEYDDFDLPTETKTDL